MSTAHEHHLGGQGLVLYCGRHGVITLADSSLAVGVLTRQLNGSPLAQASATAITPRLPVPAPQAQVCHGERPVSTSGHPLPAPIQ